MGRNKKVRVEFDRQQLDSDLDLKWPTKELRPYYMIEYNFTHGKALIRPLSDIPGREDGLKNLLQWISEDREWCFDLKLAEWDGEFPSFFRVWRPYIIGNYRHDYMDCEKLDKDPQKDNLKIIAVWGHGLGVTFEGKLGVVTNFSECGGYFLPERDEHGNRIPVQREHIGHHPESATNRSPVLNVKSPLLRYLATNKEYCVDPEFSQFNLSRINLFQPHHGSENLIIRSIILIRPEGFLMPAKRLLTLDHTLPRDPDDTTADWAPIRSRDQTSAFGAVCHESKAIMCEKSGQCMDLINETENRHSTINQCPDQVRKGNCGQFCDRYQGSLEDLKRDCEHCYYKKGFVDGRYYGEYGYFCLILPKLTLLLGNQSYLRNDPNKPNYHHADSRTRYGLMPDEVKQELFTNLTETVSSISKLGCEGQRLTLVMKTDAQKRHFTILKKLIRRGETTYGVWDSEVEKKLIAHVKVQMSGDHDGYPRHAVVESCRQKEQSPGHIVHPAVMLHVNRMRKGTLLYLLGSLGIITTYTRPIMAAKDWIRTENLLGRFSHQNLMAQTWIEQFLYRPEIDPSVEYSWIRREILEIIE